MEHYFTRKPTSPETIQIISDTLKGNDLKFKTSSSVFSKDKIDLGTRILIEAVNPYPEAVLLDVGCGYGAVGISLSFFCHSVVMIDINERACRLTQENISLNNVSNAHVVCGTLSCLKSFFDVIAMNPPLRAGKKVVFHLIEESESLLQKKGEIYLVARTRQGAKSIYSFMKTVFPQVEYASLKGGYRVMKGITD